MIEAPSHLIRAGRGQLKVLRLAIVDGRTQPVAYMARRGRGCCAVCGCTDLYACVGGCGWANASHTRCTRCLEEELLP